MQKKCKLPLLIWCLLVFAPYVLLRINKSFNLSIPNWGFNSYLFSLVLLLLSLIENRPLPVFIDTVLSIDPILKIIMIIWSIIYIILKRGRKIHIITILVTLYEFVSQIIIITHYGNGEITSYFAPLFLLLLSLWLTFLKARDRLTMRDKGTGLLSPDSQSE